MDSTKEYEVIVGYSVEGGYAEVGTILNLTDDEAKPLVDAGNIALCSEDGVGAPSETAEVPAENPGEGSAAPASEGADAPAEDAATE